MSGRSDATLNPGGVRIGTSEIYQQVENIDFITEGLVVGQDYNEDVRIILSLHHHSFLHSHIALLQ